MSYSMIVSVVVAEAIMVLLLWTALTKRTLPRVFRPLVAVVGLSASWGVWVRAVVVHPPFWMTAATGGFFLIASAGLGITIHLATRDESESAGGEGESGGGRGLVPESPGGGGGDAQPDWWPEFERQLAGYAAEQEPAAPVRQPVEC